MKIIINISNFESIHWSSSQKEGWDDIIDCVFPYIDPKISKNAFRELINDYVVMLKSVIKSKDNTSEIFICLIGEYSFCYSLFYRIKNDETLKHLRFIIPITEKNLLKKVNQYGKTITKYTHTFLNWREI